jgi:hypothetical protein
MAARRRCGGGAAVDDWVDVDEWPGFGDELGEASWPKNLTPSNSTACASSGTSSHVEASVGREPAAFVAELHGAGEVLGVDDPDPGGGHGEMVDVAAAVGVFAVVHEHGAVDLEGVESVGDLAFSLGAFGPRGRRLWLWSDAWSEPSPATVHINSSRSSARHRAPSRAT